MRITTQVAKMSGSTTESERQRKIIEKFEDLILMKDYDPSKNYDMKLDVSIDMILNTLNNFDNYETISCPKMKQLSGNDRYNIQSVGDAIHKMTVPCLPGERLDKVTLYMGTCVPKDEKQRELFYKDELTDNRWRFYSDPPQNIPIYIKLKTLSDQPNEFSFYDVPIFIPRFYSLIVEVTRKKDVPEQLKKNTNKTPNDTHETKVTEYVPKIMHDNNISIEHLWLKQELRVSQQQKFCNYTIKGSEIKI